MKIHEYQAKEIFVQYGIPINPGYLCHSVDDAIKAYEKIDNDLVVVKAQVLTGGRGKAGGDRSVLSRDRMLSTPNLLWVFSV